jgi:hypothetical protein
MVNKPQSFRAHHIARALRGVAAAGLSNPSVSVRLPTGATITIAGSTGGNKDLGPKKSAQRGKKKPAPSGGLSGSARGGQNGA